MTQVNQPQSNETPLHDIHAKLGASFTDFGGWDMPLKYGSELAEHRAVREAAGIFDLSHMGEVRITGAQAAAFLDYALVAKYSAMKIGRAKYGVIVNEAGYLLDDLITYRVGDEEFLIVPNASNTPTVVAALKQRLADFIHGEGAGDDVRLFDESADTALIAVQGPNSEAIIIRALDEGAHGEFGPRTTSADGSAASAAAVDGGAGGSGVAESERITVAEAVRELKYYAWMPLTIAGIDLVLARTGYTGEDGFELYMPNLAAARLWETLTSAGADYGLVPCGLAARDSLRLEAGMPLYGNELSLETTPFDAGLGRMIGFKTKEKFVAREALAKLGETEPARVLVGLTSEGRRAARSGAAIFASESEVGTPGAEVGTVTSGQPSPTLGHPIALAYLDRTLAEPGTPVSVDIRGKAHDFTVTALPFYKRGEN